MDQQQPQPFSCTSSATTDAVAPAIAKSSSSSSSAPTEPPQQPPQPQLQPQEPPASVPSTTQNPSAHHIPKPLPSPTPEQKPQKHLQPSALSTTPQSRPASATSTPTAALSRPWQQHAQFSSPRSPSVPTPQRGGVVLGVPAAQTNTSTPAPPSPSGPFSGSFRQQFGGISQVRQPIQRIQGIGPVGSIVATSQVRPAGIAGHHQQRPAQSLIRPPSSPSSQSLSQDSQGHGLMSASTVGSPASRASNTTQSTQLLDQASLSSGSQGKPPLPRASYRPPINLSPLQQRSHIQQQHYPLPTGSQPVPSQSSKPTTLNQQQDHSGQHFPQSRTPLPLPRQDQISRTQSSMIQKPSALAKTSVNRGQPDTKNRMANAEVEESENRILSKRSIHELVNQIDPSEKLDPEVEDILVDIAEDFVDSITTFGCSLAKHRKSDTLEAKDILLHLERNWNMTLPGFGGDEIKTYQKQVTTDIHKERLAAIKKSALATEAANTRNSFGQAAGNTKSNLGKAAANVLASPNFRIREVT